MAPTTTTPAISDVPTRADDPRLDNWYHTIELGHGLVSRGFNDHRTIVDHYGLPASLAGKTALDVGTFDGFWAFEMERRGADKVTAIDVAKLGDFDWLPRIKAQLGADADRQSNFQLAHKMRGSKVDRHILSVYDLSPEKVGMFDVVFCGDVILHLFNPLLALIKIFSVTREMAIIQTSVDSEIERLEMEKPWLSFGMRKLETIPGDRNTYWLFSTRALQEMMEYAGFGVMVPQPLFAIPPIGINSTSIVGYRDAAGGEGARVSAASAQSEPARAFDVTLPENLSREESMAWLMEELRREREKRAAVEDERAVALKHWKAHREWREELYESKLWRAGQACRRVADAFRNRFGASPGGRSA